MNQPYTINRQHWNKLSILEQMGNIGSEVGRALKLKRQGCDFEPAMIRALDLFDATVEILLTQKSYFHRIKEVLRAKEQFLDALYIKDDQGIEAYFMNFAIAARNKTSA